MKFLPFVVKHLRRAWVRTASTVLAIALSVFLFCVLQSVIVQFDRSVQSRSPRRLVTRNLVSPVFTLPLSYAPRIRAVPGVEGVSTTVIFAGMLRAPKEGRAEASEGTDWSSAFPNFAVDAESYFPMAPELRIAPEEFRSFLRDRQGCVIGRRLAQKFGWRIGDHLFLESLAPPLRKAGGPFEFVIQGLIDADRERYPGTDPNMMFFHYAYLNESLGGQLDTLYYTVQIADPARAGEIGAAIDALFANSARQTLTESESSFLAGVLSIAADLAVLVKALGLGAIFTILIVTGNTMSMAVRERSTEIAVLKTLGFPSSTVMGLIILEGLLLGASGGVVGIAGAMTALAAFNRVPGATLLSLSELEMRPAVALVAMVAAILLGVAAGLMPAQRAYRARVTELLRRP